MKKFVNFLKVFALVLAGALAGGILLIGIHYFLGLLFGVILVGVGSAVFYWCFTGKREKSLLHIPVGVVGCVLGVAVAQFFDIMVCYAPSLISEKGNLIQKTFLIYKMRYFSLGRGTPAQVISQVDVLQDFITFSVFALVFAAISIVVFYFITRKHGDETQNDGVRRYKIKGNKR